MERASDKGVRFLRKLRKPAETDHRERRIDLPKLRKLREFERRTVGGHTVPKCAPSTAAASSLALRPWLRKRVREKKPWMVPG